METIKVAVLSDIHSNLYALDACIEDAKNKGVQEFSVLGDIVNIWNYPNECVDKVRSLTPFSVMGLSEQKTKDAKTYYELWHLYDEFASYLWTEKELTGNNFDYISNLPAALSISYNDLRILAVHGSPYRMNQSLGKETDEKLNSVLNTISEDILLCGESHSQWKYEYNGKTVINPGSVGCHFNASKAAEYAIMEISDKLDKVDFINVSYDIDALISDYFKSDLYKEGCFDVNISYMGMISGINESDNFRKLLDKARSESDYALSGPVPNDIYNKVYNEYYSEKVTADIELPLFE